MHANFKGNIFDRENYEKNLNTINGIWINLYTLYKPGFVVLSKMKETYKSKMLYSGLTLLAAVT